MLNSRKANIKDSKDIWKWRNNIITRQNCTNQGVVTWSEHCDWYKNALKNRIIIISIQNKKNKIGIVRYDKVDKFEYDISININPKYRNKKYGKLVILDSEKFIKKNCVIIAKIKPSNLASINLFKSCNYKKIGKGKGLIIYKKIIDVKNLDINRINEIENYLKIINQIQNIRKKNNVNWMDILRLSFNKSPNEAKKIFSRIVADDNLINKLAKKLVT